MWFSAFWGVNKFVTFSYPAVQSKCSMFTSAEKYSSVLHLMIVSTVALDPLAVRMKYGFSMFLAVTILGKFAYS